ncbi:DNA invertase Pin-like site-specific DNA recombinase [Orenia metallireducens]|uniref:Site-specific DNA recombinase n=1 Tax=Orenia metallireducens TaxID=1413210 RepID=A0A285IDE8_9FIRM|nr:recombinase family protein [Orenia metallireducens]PRX21225.1 DNA invertase Pin-like site-specific DNA recombinase [Orenia metallireducens]SNY44991.1 Site-specific DNA recombinase [Orenia metallireducens]
MKNVAIYVRVSSREQAEEGMSIQAQIKLLKKYAIDNNFIVSHEFIDRGESARTADRPEFQNMIATAKQNPKPFEAILIHKTDRFARNREDSIIYKSLLRKECGIDVISITEQFGDGPQGRMMEGIMEVVAEFYSANLSKEVMKGMNEKASSGGALGEPPYGYSINDDTGKFDIYEPEAEVVRYIYQEYIKGGSLRSIGVDLRKNGKKLFGEVALTKKSKAIGNEGKHKDQKLTWRANTVKRVLNNKAYLGEFHWNEQIIEDNHPPIIKIKDFDLVQELLDKNKRSRRRNSKDYLLKGLVSCAECGGSLSQLTQKYITSTGEERTYRKLRCSNHVRLANCYSNLHKMDEVEDELLQFLRKIINMQVDLKTLDIKQVKNDDLTEEYLRLQTIYESFDEQFDKQMEAYQAGIIDLNQLGRYKEKLQDEQKEVKERVEILEEKINNQEVDYQSFIEELKEVIKTIEDESIDLNQKKNALLSIISEIQISKREDIMRVVFKSK